MAGQEGPLKGADYYQNPPQIVGFYDIAMKQPDYQGRDLDDILDYTDLELEVDHSYIQILFPLPERSPHNMLAPVITPKVRGAFHYRWDLRNAMRRSVNRMLNFFGFQDMEVIASTDEINGRTSSTSYDIRPQEDPQVFRQRSRRTWCMRFNHNHLRITRMIRCLRVLGDDGVARALLTALRRNDPDRHVSERTQMFWDRALTRELHLPPDENDEDAEGTAWLKEPVGHEIRWRNANDEECLLYGGGPDCTHDEDQKKGLRS